MDELKWLAHVFLVYIAPTGVATLIVGYIVNRRLEKYKNELQTSSSIQLEKFKNELQSASSVQLEKHKADLGRESKRKEILYTKLREQQAEVFETFYEKLAIMHMEACNITSVGGNPEENIKNYREPYWKAAKDFTTYFKTHRIFLTEEVCKLSDDLEVKLNVAVHRFEVSRSHQAYDFDPQGKLTEWFTAVTAVQEDCKMIKEEVEKLFRGIMRVEELSANA